jgi:hypothetical protein
MEAAGVRIRVVTYGDTGAIRQLHKRNGMGEPDPVVWRNRWEGYPFAAEFRGVPTGWVLETGEQSIVGSLANVHMLYELGGRRIKGAIAAGWVVDPDYRGKSLQLMTTFLRQKSVDVCLVVSASPTTARVLTSMKIARIPIPDYATPCFWPVHPRAFAQAALERKSVPGAAIWAWPAGLALLAREIYRGRERESSPVRRLKEFDDRFDGLWQRVNAGTTRLRAIRTRAALEWRFQAELRDGRAAIVAAEQGAMLLGYAVVVRRGGAELGMELCDVADIQAAGDSPATMRDLLLGSIRIAREEGVDAVKFMSGTPAKRAPADALRPYTYSLPFWQLYFKTSLDLGAELSTPNAWDFSLFDSY